MEKFTTKHTGDIAEYKTVAELLKRGFNVLIPCGDRLPYDMVYELNGRFIRIQVKCAWIDKDGKSWKVDVRRSQTNRATYKHTKYNISDFDFLIAWIPEGDIFYIFPSHIACSFSGAISMIENEVKRQRIPISAEYRNRWDLLT